MAKSEEKKTDWGLIILALSIGVSVACYIGKAPPAIPSIRSDLSISLITAGWIVSIFSAMGATTGIIAGIFADRVGRVKIIIFALAIISCGSILGANSNSTFLLLFSRLIEGAGYIGTMVVMPAVIAEFATRKDRALAVSLWSSVTPIGMVIGMLLAPTIIEDFGWRTLWLATGVITVGFLLLSFLIFLKTKHKISKTKLALWVNIRKTIQTPGPWLISICFMTYTFQWMAVMVWLPTYAIEQRGLNLNYSAGLAATAVAINIFGNLFGTWLIHRGVSHWLLISIGTFVMGISSLFIFSEIIPDHLRFISVLIFSFFGALQPSAIMANMPLQSPSRDQLAFTNGIVYQGSQAG
ncbi:MAG: MFS transporter, partial [Pseudomonadota bacterium]|nr:MFS transporter [Pseudomonadota bacterium]